MIYQNANQDSKKCIKRFVLNLGNEWSKSIKSEMFAGLEKKKALKRHYNKNH